MGHDDDMDHYRLRKYRGQETWDRVRAAYEAGETGPSVARRFDVGLANLRKKARKEGWTRKHIAMRLDKALEPVREPLATPAHASLPAVEPRQAVEDAMQRAGGLLAEGRNGEAQALIRSAEALARLVERTEPKPRRGADSDGGDQDGEALSDEEDMARFIAEKDAEVVKLATSLARSMLMDQPRGSQPAIRPSCTIGAPGTWGRKPRRATSPMQWTAAGGITISTHRVGCVRCRNRSRRWA